MKKTSSSESLGPVVLAAGGTGGHMFPAQALARELLARHIEVALVTDRRGGGFGPELPQVETYRIAAGGVAGRGHLRRLWGLGRLAIGYFEARALLRRLKPRAVVGFGGYASVPTVLAGVHAGVRLVLHEQNQVMGRANRRLAPKADAIATSFEAVEGLSDTDLAKVCLTGNPVRAAIAAVGPRPYGVPGPNDRLNLLVVGGSQGARAFNELLPEAVCRLPESLRRRLSVSQQVRGGELEEVGRLYAACGVECELKPFFENVAERLRTTQLVVCRAGASTVAELSAAGRPAILVPYPFAADDHQTGNARALCDAGAGWLMPQSSLTAETLAERLESLLDNPAALSRAASCARALARDDAAERLADVVCGLPPARPQSREGVVAA